MAQKLVIFLAVFAVVSANKICFGASVDATTFKDTAIPIEENGYKIIRIPEGNKSVSGGMPKPNPVLKIVGGQNAKRHEFPFMARLETYVGNNGDYYSCGASILNERFILTAAHCVIPEDKLFVTKILVYAGDHDFTVNEPCEQVVEGDYIVTKVGYDPSTLSNDIAIIKLRSDLELGPTAQKVCLASGSYAYGGKIGLVIGWGKTSHGGPLAKILQKLKTKVLSQDDCMKMAGPVSATAEKICIVNNEPKGICHGDSGGPMVVVENGIYKQIGIASYILAPCGTANIPSVYTRITTYRDFIENVVGSKLACKKCIL